MFRCLIRTHEYMNVHIYIYTLENLKKQQNNFELNYVLNKKKILRSI